MVRCSHPGCGWQALAPSEAVAWERYAEHLVAEHASTVDVDIPEGMVQIRFGDGDEWVTTTVEEAGRLHDATHGG
jgi:predicted small metal-binding protein